MRKLSMPSLAAGLLLSSVSLWAQAVNACDLNADGVDSVADIQSAINMTIGATPCASTVNVAGPAVCNAIVVQRVINAYLGQPSPINGQLCLVSTSVHVVNLTWTASTSSGITGYQVSRGASSNGPFTLVGSVGGTTTSYWDTTVALGQTYYYVVAAVAGSSVSANSTPTGSVVIPAQ
jgi:hypothetical protein